MIEEQILNVILDNKSIGILQRNRVTEDYFLKNVDEIAYIIAHFKEYSKVPDKATFISKFPDFDCFNVQETESYLVNTIREQKLYNDLIPIYKDFAGKLKEDSFTALDFIRGETRKLAESLDFLHVGSDVSKDVEPRKTDYLMRVERKGLIGIPTGLEWLDELTNGWMEEDLVTIGGYLGEGKSFILLFLLWAAWKHAGKKVLLVSREMGKVMTGFRFDTWNAHYSNLALISGKEVLGTIKKTMGNGVVVDIELTKDDYIQYLEDMKNTESPPFMVFTNEDNRTCTLEDIETLIDLYNPDIIGIDQLSLLSTTQKFSSIRDRYVYLTRELYKLTARRKLPILLAAQINRDVKKSKGKDDDSTPEMHQFQESNSIGEDSTRSITFSKKGKILSMAVKKNRYGVSGQQAFLWDIDQGILELYTAPETEEEDNEAKEKKNAKSGKKGNTIKTAEYLF